MTDRGGGNGICCSIGSWGGGLDRGGRGNRLNRLGRELWNRVGVGSVHLVDDSRYKALKLQVKEL